jgi:outer membrane protein OmpA-like peptidoglycan-associated protein
MPENHMTENRTSLLTSAQSKSSCAMKYAYLLFCVLSLALGAATAAAEELSHDEMVCALDPQCAMPIVDRRLRGVTATPTVRTPGSFDRTVNFAFNSAELTAQARLELDKVAGVLTDPSIEKYSIIINGHTDAVGGVEYNQGLSERRAEAARQYLMTQHAIDGNRLIAKGYGKSQLLLPTDPTNELNRRVQFQNANYAAASVPTVAPRPATATRPNRTESAPPAEGEGL